MHKMYIITLYVQCIQLFFIRTGALGKDVSKADGHPEEN